MLAKVFQGKKQTLEGSLIQWLMERGTTVKDSCMAVGKDNVVTLVVFYDEPKAANHEATQMRLRGTEKPGEPPTCRCGAPMIRRERKADGAPFWGCSKFPECKGIVNFDREDLEAERRRNTPDETEFGGQGGYEEPQGDLFGDSPHLPEDDDIPF